MKRLITTFVSLTLVFAVTTGINAADTLERVKEKGVLVVGVLGDIPPFGFRDGGVGPLVGYDVDFTRAIAAKLGVKAELKEISEFNKFAEIMDGKVDLIVAALTHNEFRAKVIDLSDHYLVSGQKVVAPRGTIKTHEDLKGKRIGAVIGTFSEVCAKDRCKVSTVVPFESYLEGALALRRGEIDAFTSDESILLDLFAGFSLSEFEIPELLILKEEFHIGIKKGAKNLQVAVNKAILELQESGEAKRIRDRWFAPQEQVPPPAYGSIMRKASASPRFLGIALQGVLYPGSEVSIFSLDGKELGKGTISSIFGDDFYIDVEDQIYDLVRPGYLVAMNMTDSMAFDVLTRRGDLLESIKAESEKEARKVRTEIDREALEKQKQQREINDIILRNRANERSRYYRSGSYYRGFRGYRRR
jgi:polar amino acid transport system substrate-binding protein